MAEVKKTTRPRRAPARTPEAREQQLVSLAYDVAEKQMEEGSASSQVVTHFLKMGSIREKLELERIRKENLLLEAKAQAIASAARQDVLYKEAMDAFRNYKGAGENAEPEDYDD